jgi:hypothetical protein
LEALEDRTAPTDVTGAGAPNAVLTASLAQVTATVTQAAATVNVLSPSSAFVGGMMQAGPTATPAATPTTSGTTSSFGALMDPVGTPVSG